MPPLNTCHEYLNKLLAIKSRKHVEAVKGGWESELFAQYCDRVNEWPLKMCLLWILRDMKTYFYDFQT